MITSRKIDDLLPPVAEQARRLVELCAENDIQIIITSTYRDFEAQDRLYAQGRAGMGGPIVTYARAGDSWHNWKRAFDVVPLKNGKPVWSIRGLDKQMWLKVGKLGTSLGLEWGGNWLRHPDYPHFQNKTGRTLYGLKKEAGLIS